MTSVTLTWSAAWILMAAAVGVRLWRASSSYEPFVRSGYRWLAAAALCLGIGGAMQRAFGGVIGGAAPLRVADLVSLAALPAVVIGLATITAEAGDRDRPLSEPSRWRLYHDRAAYTRPASGALLDSALLVVSLFAIGLVVRFGGDYTRSGLLPGSFALDLIRPVADLAALGLALTLVPRSPRLAAGGVLALVAVTVSDSLAVAGRSLGHDAGTGAHLALVVAIALLAVTPSANVAAAGTADAPAGQLILAESSWHRLARTWSALWRIAAPVTAAVAALVIAGSALFGRPVATSAVAVTAAIGVILLVIRLGWFARRASNQMASARASDSVFRVLADSTSDTVLICDRSGTIEYVSYGSGEFGYGTGRLTGPELAGTSLADIVHPEDRRAGVRAAMTALRSASGTVTFIGRARGADGSWRPVKAMLTRYAWPGEPARLLITCRDDSEVVALRRQLTQLTFHDGLTGLPNRAYLEDRVKDLRQGGGDRTTVAAILVGLDSHAPNDDLGGQPGENLVLAQAGRRLRAAVPPDAIVARWGGEQFAVLVADVVGGSVGLGSGALNGAGGLGSADPATGEWPQVAELAGRLVDAIGAEPFVVAAHEVWMTASVGVAISSAATADQVLGNAQLAMAKAAQARGGQVTVFGAAMEAVTRRRIELAAALGDAVTDQQLRVEYLPVVEFATAVVTWVEALISWRLAGELIDVNEVLAAAEDSGQIIELGDWLLRAAARQTAAWRAGGSAIGLAVHVSVRQLSAPGFVTSTRSALEAAGLPPQALMLTVDERVLTDAGASLKSELARLRAAGIRIAIDDFGSGYASLSYLRQLAVDAIKIDSSLTAGLGVDPTLTLLTSAIAGLGRDLGIEVIATGVDRPDQAELLQTMGCDLGQGAWLARQRAASAVEPAGAGVADAWTSRDQAGDPACSPAG